jgi:hypothetical protein
MYGCPSQLFVSSASNRTWGTKFRCILCTQQAHRDMWDLQPMWPRLSWLSLINHIAMTWPPSISRSIGCGRRRRLLPGDLTPVRKHYACCCCEKCANRHTCEHLHVRRRANLQCTPSWLWADHTLVAQVPGWLPRLLNQAMSEDWDIFCAFLNGPHAWQAMPPAGRPCTSGPYFARRVFTQSRFCVLLSH